MESVLLYVLGVVIIVVGLVISIGLHEVGHLIPAKRFGVRVGQYMIGFGPTVFSKKVGETQYGFKAIPLGGYISMAGMFPPARAGGKPRTASTGFFDTLVQDARDASFESSKEAGVEGIPASQRDRLFYKLPWWKRIIIMLGGPVMNLILAFVFLGIVLVGFGLPQSTSTVGTVYQCVVAATSTQTECTDADPASPAAAAGLVPGDRIVSINGTPISGPTDASPIIAAAAGTPLTVAIVRDGKDLTLTVTPLLTERPVVDADNKPVTDADGAIVTHKVGFIGIGYAVQNVQRPVSDVPGFVLDSARRIGYSIITLPGRVVELAQSTFGGTPRDPNGIIGVVGIGRLAGEITSLDTLPVADRASSLIGLLGSLNLALFLFNLVPLLPLDGGHIAGALWEAIRRRFAKWFKRPDPGPVDVAKLIPLTMAISSVLLVLTVFVVFADIVNPVSLF